MSEIEILSELKTQLISFFDELIGQFPQEGDLVVVRLFLANQIPIQSIMDVINHKINMLKLSIYSVSCLSYHELCQH